MVGPIQRRRCHIGIAEDICAFVEARIGHDDHVGGS